MKYSHLSSRPSYSLIPFQSLLPQILTGNSYGFLLAIDQFQTMIFPIPMSKLATYLDFFGLLHPISHQIPPTRAINYSPRSISFPSLFLTGQATPSSVNKWWVCCCLLVIPSIVGFMSSSRSWPARIAGSMRRKNVVSSFACRCRKRVARSAHRTVSFSILFLDEWIDVWAISLPLHIKSSCVFPFEITYWKK